MKSDKLNPLQRHGFGANQRVQIWYALLLLIAAIFVVRLFYLQVIRHDYYRHQALNAQLKEYTIPAERGIIEAHEGDTVVPFVLNVKLYTLFADPTYIKNPDDDAQKLVAITKGDKATYASLMRTKGTRYAVLATKLSPDQQKQIDKLQLLGVGTREATYRTYPQGSLASQLLGFVDADGNGKYGVEQALQDQLAGKPGLLKAITDANGVPLVSNRSNIDIDPQSGKNVVLTVDLGMQRQLEDILKQGLKSANSDSGSALILDPYTGAVKAMANYPTYSPAEYYKVQDGSLFTNPAVSSPLEVGSSMKPLTAAAALNSGAVTPNQTYYDPSHFTVDGFTIKNIEEDGGAGTRSVNDILTYSLNTGATWLLMQMGGGQINTKARTTWYNYMTNHYRFGKTTGIEQGYESPGTIPDPNTGYALDLTYANTAFGQAMTATPLQMGLALSSVINGGTYYQAHLVDQYVDDQGNTTTKAPKVLEQNVVSPQVGSEITGMMKVVADRNISPNAFPASYVVGGKTGTAQIAKPGGGYYDNLYNGTYIGFVGGDKPQYVIVVLVNKPHVNGYAGHDAAQPIFVNLTHMLINGFGVTPKSQ